MDVYNQFAKFFIQLSFLFVNTSIIFPEMQHALRLAIIYHAVGQNTRTKIQKDVFLSKMPLDECSAAMGYLRFCFVVLIEAIRVILISRQRVSKRSYSADEIIFVLLNNSNQ